jgi:hypothetical protein
MPRQRSGHLFRVSRNHEMGCAADGNGRGFGALSQQLVRSLNGLMAVLAPQH